MFKLTQSPTFWAPVAAEFTTEEGKRATLSFQAKFKRPSEDEYQAFAVRLKPDDAVIDVAEKTSELRAICREIVVGWKDVEGDDGPAPFTPEGLGQMLDLGMAVPIFSAFMAHAPKAKVKN